MWSDLSASSKLLSFQDLHVRWTDASPTAFVREKEILFIYYLFMFVDLIINVWQ